MLSRLFIRNFALIEETSIEFGPGLNVITGETGAGKSILMGALYSILGGPAGADLVRSGADRCQVEGLFEFAADDPVAGRLAALDCPLEDGQLVLRREILAEGRSRALANGLSVPQKRLRQLGALLVDLHGQHEHQYLLDPERHAAFLDAFGGLQEAAAAVASLHRQWREAEQHHDRLRAERQALAEEESLRRQQLEEIRALAPEPDEEDRLAAELKVLENAETLAQLSAELNDLLYEADGSVVEQLGRARRQLERLVEIDPSLEGWSTALEELRVRLEDLASAVGRYGHGLEFQPERTEALRLRGEALRRLRRKYGGTLGEVLTRADDLERQQNRSGELDAEVDEAKVRVEESRRRFAEACAALTAGRTRAARDLAKAVAHGLADLGMPQVGFRAELRSQEDPEGPVELDGKHWRADQDGMERVEFAIAPNQGEELRPLARIASGGEISRVMLVLKEAIAAKDAVSTLVFDEIDVGISGRIAAAVGRKLRQLSASHQTIAITHLPQIAGLAEHHFSVRKRQAKGRTFTEVHPLAPEERAEEIAALLAGDTVSDTARQHAQEMLR
ncbi:MAG: DNA repair protein RecN [Candidatus Latescibacterota bacterium]|jgi:DNA repair protein RecN (Recombination protein N)